MPYILRAGRNNGDYRFFGEYGLHGIVYRWRGLNEVDNQIIVI
jgi:hypothetical protein